MAGQGDSNRAILFALGANFTIFVTKGVAAFITGSGAMLAETVHSLADCGNQLLLLLGLRQARMPPSPEYPLGYGKAIYFWGDCAHHQVASLAQPDWHCVFDVDKEQGAATRKRVFDMLATDRLPVIGYHMPFPSVGYVERRGTAYRWLPHTYQLSL